MPRKKIYTQEELDEKRRAYQRDYNKRKYVKGEDTVNPGDIGKARLVHNWYDKANKLSEFNAHNFFKQTKMYTWEDVYEIH